MMQALSETAMWVGTMGEEPRRRGPRFRFLKQSLVWTTVIVGCSLSACQRSAEIGRYQVAHEPSHATVNTDASTTTATVASPASAHRMLAAIVPDEGQAWFFKLTGPVNDVETLSKPFRSLVESVSFAADGKPNWRLPDGWKREAGNQFRFATLRAAEGEISVSALPLPGGKASNEYILSNVNRWRNQLQLAPIKNDQLPESSESIEVGGRSVVLVDITGTGTAGARPRGPFQSPGPIAPTTAEEKSPKPGDGGRQHARGMSFVAPKGWREGPKSGFRLATFLIEQDGQTAEVTVIALGTASGSDLDNVNRWRQQAGLPPIQADALEKQLKSLDIDGTASKLIHINEAGQGTRKAISAVIIPRSDRTLFLKMTGPNKLVEQHSAAFEKFARSVRFEAQ